MIAMEYDIDNYRDLDIGNGDSFDVFGIDGRIEFSESDESLITEGRQ